MALRKIKDLIREMVFDNQSNVHQYAEVMANLVFDRNKFDEYDAKLDEAEQNAAKYDNDIQQINAYIKQQKEALDELISKKKSGKLLSEDEKANLINLNKKIGQQTKKQRETIAEKTQNGFVKLNPVIKKYACLRYLSNEYVKNADFKTEIGTDGFIYADEYEFKSSSIATNFREISDYVDYIFGNRESKITEPKSIVDIIRADAKELDLTIDKLTPANIVNIYNKLLARIAEENRNKQTENEQIEQSQIGIKPVRDFGDGLVMYRLLPDTEYYNEHGEHRNLVYESDQMGICIGQKGQSYSQKILNQDKNQYYTLRSRNKNGQLIPHCTIEVNGDVVSQVKGKSNGTVNGNYIQPVRKFLKQHLNVAFPEEENTKNKRELYDYSNIGFIEDADYKIVDIFNLPPNTELGKISYDLLSIKGIDLKNVKSIEELNCYGCKITQQGLDQIKNNNLIKYFDLKGAKLFGPIDFNNEESLILEDCDLSKAEITFNPNAKSIDLTHAKGLSGTYDFRNVKKLILYGCDLSEAKIEFNSNADRIDLTHAKGLSSTYDFSGVQDLLLSECDLNKVKIKFNPNAKYIRWKKVTGLRGVYDFGGVETLYLSECDLSKAEIKFNPNKSDIRLGKITGLHGTHDLSGTESLDSWECDLSKAEIKFNPNAERISFYRTTGLHGVYDFSGVKKLNFWECDLSNVTKIIVNQQLFDDIIGSINESDRHKFVVAKPESKVDLLNKGIKNLKNRLNIDTQQLTEKISASDREND